MLEDEQQQRLNKLRTRWPLIIGIIILVALIIVSVVYSILALENSSKPKIARFIKPHACVDWDKAANGLWYEIARKPTKENLSNVTFQFTKKWVETPSGCRDLVLKVKQHGFDVKKRCWVKTQGFGKIKAAHCSSGKAVFKMSSGKPPFSDTLVILDADPSFDRFLVISNGDTKRIRLLARLPSLDETEIIDILRNLVVSQQVRLAKLVWTPQTWPIHYPSLTKKSIVPVAIGGKDNEKYTKTFDNSDKSTNSLCPQDDEEFESTNDCSNTFTISPFSLKSNVTEAIQHMCGGDKDDDDEKSSNFTTCPLQEEEEEEEEKEKEKEKEKALSPIPPPPPPPSSPPPS